MRKKKRKKRDAGGFRVRVPFFFLRLSPLLPCECSEMAFPRNWLKSLAPMALRTTTTKGAKGPPVALLPMRVVRREEVVVEVEAEEDEEEVEGAPVERPA